MRSDGELSDVELQLELTDTPETRVIKRQLRTMNPQQRAQALRMLQAQADEAQRTGVTPQAVGRRRRRDRNGRRRTASGGVLRRLVLGTAGNAIALWAAARIVGHVDLTRSWWTVI